MGAIYTLTTSGPTADGRIEIYADARIAGTSNVLQAFPAGGTPLAVLPAPPGTSQ